MIAHRDNDTADVRTKPAWLTDETVPPPYPILRCPDCKRLFSDHEIHLCRKSEVGAIRHILGPEFNGR